MLLFDTMVFVGGDGRVYASSSARHTDGIYGVELDRKDLTHFAAPPKKLWTFNRAHVWERYGDNNEGTQLSWVEAHWMTKRNGRYYLQYSAPGTEWKTYAVGVYTAKSPLGPFTYAPRNPILVHHNGLINGTGHHTVVEGPDGNLWAVYTILYRNWGVFDRRIGLDPVGFDRDGNMFVAGPTETPRWGPRAARRRAAQRRSSGFYSRRAGATHTTHTTASKTIAPPPPPRRGRHTAPRPPGPAPQPTATTPPVPPWFPKRKRWKSPRTKRS